MKWILLSIFLLLPISKCAAACLVDTANPTIARCDYHEFEVWLSCKDRLAILSVIHQLNKDIGKKDTKNRNYFLDELAASTNCQQLSRERYSVTHKGYDVGHLSAIDHFDYDLNVALKTNAMTNLVPQAAKFNRTGAWKRTEVLVECYRETNAPLTVYSGVILGNDTSNDFFGQSHGVLRTPDLFWKLVIGNKQYDAWVMPNNNDSDVASLTFSRRSIEQIILLLELQNEDIYRPVIKKLVEVNSTKPKQTQFVYHSQCNLRKG